MGLFSFLSKPQMPPISMEDAVITWFLLYDDKIRIRKTFPELFDRLKDDILSDLQKYTDEKALQEHVKKISNFYETEVLTKIAQMNIRNSEDVSLLMTEVSIAAKMRILGYFLLKKYNIQPE